MGSHTESKGLLWGSIIIIRDCYGDSYAYEIITLIFVPGSDSCYAGGDAKSASPILCLAFVEKLQQELERLGIKGFTMGMCSSHHIPRV